MSFTPTFSKQKPNGRHSLNRNQLLLFNGLLVLLLEQASFVSTTIWINSYLYLLGYISRLAILKQKNSRFRDMERMSRAFAPIDRMPKDNEAANSFGS